MVAVALGGAAQAVVEMLMAIQQDGSNSKKYVLKAKDKNDPFRLMGFGHRVYKHYDPRAKILREMCEKLMKQIGSSDPLLNIAMELEQVALHDEYFIERHFIQC